MCRYMNINAWGTDNFLKQHIRNKLEKVRVDDMVRGLSQFSEMGRETDN